MDYYELDFTIPSPESDTKFVEFSPNGRFLAVGDEGFPSFCILDRLAGFYPTISVATLAEPTALVWETSNTLYVGLGDGCFIYYAVDPVGKRLVKGPTNRLFRGGFPVTAISLDAESRTLVLSVGPDVFAFRRVRVTDEFRFVANISSRFNFKRDPGSPAPPFPRSICFISSNTLLVAFCRQNIASITLEFDEDSRLLSSLQTAKIDYSGLPLLKAVTSASDEEIHRLTRFWVYGNESRADSDGFPFLFINGGAATLSGTTLGTAVVKDTVTQREIQRLEHTGIYLIAPRRISAMAYYVSNDKYNIATADCGTNSTIKIWTARRPPSDPQTRAQRRFLVRRGWVIITFMVASIAAILSKTRKLPNTDQISQFCFRIALAFAEMCIQIGYLILGAVEDAFSDGEVTVSLRD